MNKEEYNQIIDEAYENYCKSFDAQSEIESHSFDTCPMTKIMFVEKIKNFDWFSEKWGLKIEERELNMFERWELSNLTPNMSEIDYCNKLCDEHNVPTRLITLTYKENKIESYE